MFYALQLQYINVAITFSSLKRSLILSLSRDVTFLIFIVSEHMRVKASVKERSKQIRDIPRETNDKRFLSRRDAFETGTRLKIYEATFGNDLGKGLLDADDRAGRNGFMGIIIF